MENPKYAHRFFIAIVLSISAISIILSIRHWDTNLLLLAFIFIGSFALCILFLTVFHFATFAPVFFLISWLFGDKSRKQPINIANKSIDEDSTRD